MKESKFLEFRTNVILYMVVGVVMALLIHFVVLSSDYNTFWLTK
jgi:uncharacterized membrane protein YgaE (UPF0421/DUF939 family)